MLKTLQQHYVTNHLKYTCTYNTDTVRDFPQFSVVDRFSEVTKDLCFKLLRKFQISLIQIYISPFCRRIANLI